MAQLPRQQGRAGVAFEHVVTRHQVDGPTLVGRSPVHDRHQVTTGQRMHLGERFGQGRGHHVYVHAGRAKQRRHQVDMRGGRRDRARLGCLLADAGNDERHPGCLVIEVEPLLVQSAMRSEQIAMVGGAHQHGILGSALGDRAAHPVDRPVDLGVQAVVEVPVALRVAGIVAADHTR
ncbi:Uncharacterised protein [Mycobacterium tuberculosis]|nr:Uncharacterised protein [Mycobacterium tuberculosis]